MAETKPKPIITSSEDVSNLRGEVLTLMEIINIARGADPETQFKKSDLPDLWWHRYRDLLQRVELGEVPSVKIYAKPKFRRVAIHDLAPFANSLGDDWQWLRDFCKRWALARGDDPHTDRIDAAAPAARAPALSPIGRRQWFKKYYAEQERQLAAGKIKRPPNRDADYAAAKGAFPKISRAETRALRKEFAPEKFKKGGRREEN